MTNLTIRDLSNEYQTYANLTFRKHGRPTRSANNVRDAIRELLETPWPAPPQPPETVVATLPVERMTVRVLKQVQRTMETSGRLNRQTVNDRVNTIRRMFRWAVDEGFLESPEIAERLKYVAPLRRHRSQAPEPEGVTAVEETLVQRSLTALAEELEDRRTPERHRLGKLMLATLIESHWLIGCRPGEAVMMSRQSIVEQTVKLLDGSTATVWLYRPSQFKGELYDKPRVIPIGPGAQCILRAWMRRATGQWLFEGNTRGKPTGRPMLESSYYNALRRLNRRHGIQHWHPHQIRHSFITRMTAFESKDIAQALAGHSDMKTTEGYIDIDHELLMRMMRVMHEHG